jgi:ABC-type transport system involved in cytochrome bd biosynthesis fused ATPase/permease subunit
MKVHVAWVAAAVVGIIVLVLASLFVEDATSRTLLALFSLVPVLYVTSRLSRKYEYQLAQERRRFSKLRTVTSDFIISVRNLNRLKVLAQEGKGTEDTQGMIEEVVQRMRQNVDRIVEAAGQEDREEAPGGGPIACMPVAAV